MTALTGILYALVIIVAHVAALFILAPIVFLSIDFWIGVFGGKMHFINDPSEKGSTDHGKDNDGL